MVISKGTKSTFPNPAEDEPSGLARASRTDGQEIPEWVAEEAMRASADRQPTVDELYTRIDNATQVCEQCGSHVLNTSPKMGDERFFPQIDIFVCDKCLHVPHPPASRPQPPPQLTLSFLPNLEKKN